MSWSGDACPTWFEGTRGGVNVTFCLVASSDLRFSISKSGEVSLCENPLDDPRKFLEIFYL